MCVRAEEETKGMAKNEENSHRSPLQHTNRPKKNRNVANRRTNRKYKNRLPEDLALKVGEANAAFADENYALAVELLAEVSARCPTEAEPRITMGTVYETMGNPVQAVCCFGDAARRLCEGYLWSLRDAAEMFARAAGLAKEAYEAGGVHWLVSLPSCSSGTLTTTTATATATTTTMTMTMTTMTMRMTVTMTTTITMTMTMTTTD